MNVGASSAELEQVRGRQGDRLAELRKKYGWSMLVCSTAMGVSYSTYRRYEYGLASPQADALRRFHKQLKPDESLHWLITGAEHGEAQAF